MIGPTTLAALPVTLLAYDKPNQSLSNTTPGVLSHLKVGQVATVVQTCNDIVAVYLNNIYLIVERTAEIPTSNPTSTPMIGPTASTPVPTKMLLLTQRPT